MIKYIDITERFVRYMKAELAYSKIYGYIYMNIEYGIRSFGTSKTFHSIRPEYRVGKLT